ncbi:hypothetical protein LXL04_017336 [Taraxacum kok-saghyz]
MEKVLEEYGVLTLGVNQGSLKYVTREKKPYFKYNTIFTKSKDFDGSMNRFSFVNFQIILDNKIESDMTFDVTGYVVRLFLYLSSDLKIFITLWEHYGNEVVDTCCPICNAEVL